MKKIYIVLCMALLITIIVISRYIDLINNSDVINFLGAICGALIGIWGALFVIYKDRNYEKEKNIEKLIEMFKHTFIWVYPKSSIGFGNSINSISEPIVPLLYDDKWKEYISDIDNIHHRRFLLSWFYTLEKLENKNEFISKVKENHIDDAIEILKSYNLYDKEIKDLEKEVNGDNMQNIKAKIISLSNRLDNIIDEEYARMEVMEDAYEQMEKELAMEEGTYQEEDYTYCELDELYKELENTIRSYDKELVRNSKYKF